MSINWSKKDFASRLQTIDVPVRELRVGDIVVEDGNPWGVARIDKKAYKGKLGVFDEDENGGIYDPDTLRSIIPRGFLRTSKKSRS